MTAAITAFESRSWLYLCAALISAEFWSTAAAQVPSDTVQWTGLVLAKSARASDRDGTRDVEATIELSARVQEGWHVYALTQPPGGPTPLRLTLEQNTIARAAGPASGTTPEQKFDPSFELETQYYTHSFTLHLPVRVSQLRAAGRRQIPVSVRFQTCNGRECEPPKTIHLSVPVDGTPPT